MKVAISIPDALGDAVDRHARRAGISRSRLFALAANDYMARMSIPDDPTEAWNRAIARGGQPGDDDAARAFRMRSREVIRRGPGASK